MLAVGVTGGIGSGKSVVCDVFETLTVPVYRADTEARRIMEGDEDVIQSLTGYFGREVFSGGSLNRKWLADRLFSSEQDREFVNSTVHPAVYKDFAQWSAQYVDRAYVIEEAALLFESGAHGRLDLVILVTAPRKLRIERVMKRDGLKRREVSARMASQMNSADAVKLADHVIVNDEVAFVLPQVLEIHNKIMYGL